ncbi:hypothetical protein CAPTEDRAFT_207287 [Capitella teleta]|uniref:Homeobox domain-containing protein n=1 Tax=Capitella teleta TaxID=283909 RepID=R7UP51_CAPTE|nr:hypothetical protein CAPTEDRAFT_207287 [Capitella teleta]|eukprot:ELU07975.1 hypothetical protein CAPTEDRAFT_207287 [Capitella teleta]
MNALQQQQHLHSPGTPLHHQNAMSPCNMNSSPMQMPSYKHHHQMPPHTNPYQTPPHHQPSPQMYSQPSSPYTPNMMQQQPHYQQQQQQQQPMYHHPQQQNIQQHMQQPHQSPAHNVSSVPNAMRYRDNRSHSPHRQQQQQQSHHPPPLPPSSVPGLSNEFDDPPSPGRAQYAQDRIQNDLLDEICSDIGIKDAIDLDMFDFVAQQDPYALQQTKIADELLGDIDQTIPFGSITAEQTEKKSKAPLPLDEITSVASPTISSSCNSNQVSLATTRPTHSESPAESPAVDSTTSSHEKSEPEEKPTSDDQKCLETPGILSRFNSQSSLGSPTGSYKDLDSVEYPSPVKDKVPQSPYPGYSSPAKASNFKTPVSSQPAYFSLGSPSCATNAKFANLTDDHQHHQKMARYLESNTTSAATSKSNSPTQEHVAKRAKMISNGNDLLEEVREVYSFTKGADLYAPPSQPASQPQSPNIPVQRPKMTSQPYQFSPGQQSQPAFNFAQTPSRFGPNSSPYPQQQQQSCAQQQQQSQYSMPRYPNQQQQCSNNTYNNQQQSMYGSCPDLSPTKPDCNYNNSNNQYSTSANCDGYSSTPPVAQAQMYAGNPQMQRVQSPSCHYKNSMSAPNTPQKFRPQQRYMQQPQQAMQQPQMGTPGQPPAQQPYQDDAEQIPLSQHGFMQRLINDRSSAFRSNPLFPLLRDLIIADMNFHSPSFPFALIANLPADFDRLLQNYLSRNPPANGNQSQESIQGVVLDALKYAHSALIEKIRRRKIKEGYEEPTKSINAIEDFCERFDRAVKNNGMTPQLPPPLPAQDHSMPSPMPPHPGTPSHMMGPPTPQQSPYQQPPYSPSHHRDPCMTPQSQPQMFPYVPPHHLQQQQQQERRSQSLPPSPHGKMLGRCPPPHPMMMTPQMHMQMPHRDSCMSDFNIHLAGKRSHEQTTQATTGKNKVLPKEAVQLMLDWLRKHQDNPYPNDDEKEMLIQKTKLTINQINYWFTNARRRILPKWALQRYMEQQEKQKGEDKQKSKLVDEVDAPPLVGSTNVS